MASAAPEARASGQTCPGHAVIVAGSSSTVPTTAPTAAAATRSSAPCSNRFHPAWNTAAARTRAKARPLTGAHRRGELSFTYPVARGVAPFLITLGGALVLGESLDAARICGSLALGVGLGIISYAGLAKGRGAALTFAALTGVTIAVYSVIDADAVRSANALGYLGLVTAVEAILLLGAVRLDWTRLRASARAGAGVGAGSLVAYLLVLLAYQRAPASPVATLRELSILLGILMSRDKPGWRVWIGGTLCVLGAALTVL